MNKDDQVEASMSGEKSVRPGVTHEDSAKSGEKEESVRRGRSQLKTGHVSRIGNVDKNVKLKDIRCVTSTPIKKVTIETLKEQLRNLHLPITGNKAELQRRLEGYKDKKVTKISIRRTIISSRTSILKNPTTKMRMI